MTARIDSRIDSDKVEFANMEDTDTIKHKKSINISRFTTLMKNRVNVALVLSAFCIILILGTILGAAIRINQLSAELNSLKSSNQNGGNTPSAAQTQKLKSDSTTSKSSSYNFTENKVTIATLKADLDKMKSDFITSQKLNQVKDLLGSTYVRWGKSTCPSDAELLYAGFAAGSSTVSSRLSGGGANFLCLPLEPEWNKYDIKNDTLAFSWMYAAEYLTYDLGIFPDETHGHTVPCSMCKSPRTSKVMIPAKRSCPDSWTKEYEGYLMSSYVTQNKMTFECVDENPDVIEGSQNVTGGAAMYFVSGYCGSRGGLGQCPPYVPARELTCVICTK